MKLGVITDIHVCPPGTPPLAWHNPYDLEGAVRRLDLAMARLEKEGVEAIAVLGDLTSFADAGSLGRCLQGLARTRAPLRIVPGNHDAEPGGVDLGDTITSFGDSRISLARPSGEPLAGWRLAGVGIERTDETGRWSIQEIETAAWGSNPVILMSHSPLIDRDAAYAAAHLRIVGSFADPSGVLTALSERDGPTIVLHGHVHIRDAIAVGPVLQLGFAALIEPPNDIAVVELNDDADDVHLLVHCLPIEPVPAEHLPVLVPAEQTWRFADGVWTELAANPV